MTTPRPHFAVTFTQRERAELLPLDLDPTPLAPDELSGTTLATLVSGGTEVAGSYLGTTFPWVPGYSAVFEVEEVGSAITDIAVGDRVFCLGRHQSFQRMRRDEVVPVPAGLASEVAVFARLMQVSMTTLSTTTARPTSKVLVTGLGTVGHLAAQIFAACGYEVTACDPSPSRRAIAEAAGIQRVLADVPVDDPAFAGKVALVLECSGHEAAVMNGCKVVQKRGEVVTIGTPWRKQTDISAHEILNAVFFRYAVIRSGWEWEIPAHTADFQPYSRYGNVAAALAWLDQGKINVDSLYSIVKPQDADSIYQALMNQRFEHLAAVYDWSAL